MLKIELQTYEGDPVATLDGEPTPQMPEIVLHQGGHYIFTGTYSGTGTPIFRASRGFAEIE